MPRRGVVVDRHGNVVESDDDVVRDGQVLRVPGLLMDSARREDDDEEEGEGDDEGEGDEELSDAERQHRIVCDAYLDMKARISRGMFRNQVPFAGADGGESDEDLSDEEAAEARRSRAYAAYRRRLGAPKARKQRLPKNEEWTRL